MKKKAISALIASALGGVLVWLKRSPKQTPVVGRTMEDAPLSATSLSAQPHKRQRIARPVGTTKSDVPQPDSAAKGRTPYYFVPGEALVTLHSPDRLSEAFLAQVAQKLKGEYAPLGEETIDYLAPEEGGWFTVLRLRWPNSTGYEETLKRFSELEAQVNTRLTWDEKRVTTWMPNWLGTLTSAPQMYTPGGPASYPRPLPPPAKGNLSLVDAPFLHQWREEMAHPVTLAVLDAFPSAEALQSERLPFSIPKSLMSMLESLCSKSHTLTLDGSQHYATSQSGKPFEMSDHGLVTAWLATEVIGEAGMEANYVTLEPVPVATASGVCSAADVIAGLAPLARRINEGENMVILLPFVIGMSHVVPPRMRPYEEHYEALRLLCLSINEAGGTLIGAAGNDASGLQHPPRTRLPASFRSVIDVTAGQLQQTDLALYANQAKSLCFFGGEANLQSEIVNHLPALIGPAVSPNLRSSTHQVEANESGWVGWAGTSFAAALAAGLAVLRRSHNPKFKMWDIRTQLRKVASDTRNPGNVPFVDLVRPASG